DVTSGNPRAVLDDPSKLPNPLLFGAFSPDGSTLATAGDDGTTRVWSRNGVLQARLVPDDPIFLTSVTFSPTGTTLMTTGGDHKARVWDAATGKKVLVLEHPTAVRAAAFDPSEKWIVTGADDGSVRRWDAESGALLATLSGHGQEINGVAVSPDGATI